MNTQPPSAKPFWLFVLKLVAIELLIVLAAYWFSR
jgi:hypothetical protein